MMRITLPAVLLLASLGACPVLAANADPKAGAAAAPETADRLRLADAQTMAGDFLGFTADQGAQFRHPACDGVLMVKADHLDTLFPRPACAKTAAPTADWRLTFNNGDTVAGKLVSYAADKLILDTPFAGRLEIAPAAIASLTPLAASDNPGSLTGVGKAQDWTRPQAFHPMMFAFGLGGPQPRPPAAKAPPQSAAFKDGQLLVPPTGIMRTLDMRAKSRLDLTLEGSPAFTVEFASEAAANGKESLQSFQIAPSHVSITEVTREPGSMTSQSGGMFRRSGAKPGPTTLSFLTDAKGHRVTLMVNGEKIGGAAFPVASIGKRLVLRSHGGELRLSHLALTPDTTALDPGAPARGAADTATLSNGDKAEGTLLSIAGGKASFKTEAGTLDFPAARLRGITLSAAHNLAQAAGQDTVRAYAGNDCRLTLKVAQIKDGVLSGSAAGLGNVALPLGATEKLVFNPQAKMPSRETPPSLATNDAQPAPVFLQGEDNIGAIHIGGADIQVIQGGAGQALPAGQIPPQVLRRMEQMQRDALDGLQNQGQTAQEADAKPDEAPAPGQPI